MKAQSEMILSAHRFEAHLFAEQNNNSSFCSIYSISSIKICTNKLMFFCVVIYQYGQKAKTRKEDTTENLRTYAVCGKGTTREKRFKIFMHSRNEEKKIPFSTLFDEQNELECTEIIKYVNTMWKCSHKWLYAFIFWTYNVHVAYAHAVHTCARTLFLFIFHFDCFLLFSIFSSVT